MIAYIYISSTEEDDSRTRIPVQKKSTLHKQRRLISSLTCNLAEAGMHRRYRDSAE